MRFPRAGAVRAGKCDLFCRQRMNALRRVTGSAGGCCAGGAGEAGEAAPGMGAPSYLGALPLARDLSSHLSSPSPLFPNVQLVICM